MIGPRAQSPSEATDVLCTQFFRRVGRDRRIRFNSKDGVYSTKSGYKFFKRLLDPELPNFGASTSRVISSDLWKAVWCIKGPPKVSHFLWRACNMTLPIKEILFKRRCVKDPICPWCGEFNESVEHMLFFCSRARAVWFCSPLALRVNLSGLNAIEDWIEEFLWKNKNFEERDKTLFACLCWGIWKDRCN